VTSANDPLHDAVMTDTTASVGLHTLVWLVLTQYHMRGDIDGKESATRAK